jgi:hypothetical protein
VAKQGRLADGGQPAVEGSRRVEVDGLHHLPQVAGPDAGPQPGAARLDRAEQQRRGLGPDDLAGAGQHVDGDARRVVGTLERLGRLVQERHRVLPGAVLGGQMVGEQDEPGRDGEHPARARVQPQHHHEGEGHAGGADVDAEPDEQVLDGAPVDGDALGAQGEHDRDVAQDPAAHRRDQRGQQPDRADRLTGRAHRPGDDEGSGDLEERGRARERQVAHERPAAPAVALMNGPGRDVAGEPAGEQRHRRGEEQPGQQHDLAERELHRVVPELDADEVEREHQRQRGDQPPRHGVGRADGREPGVSQQQQPCGGRRDDRRLERLEPAAAGQAVQGAWRALLCHPVPSVGSPRALSIHSSASRRATSAAGEDFRRARNAERPAAMATGCSG